MFTGFFLYTPSKSDNPTSIIPPLPGPDPGYIIAESSSGLGNRLRVMAAYMYIAEFKYSGAHLIFIWEKNEACPGHFLSLFEAIPNVLFANNGSRYVIDKQAKINYENSFAVFNWIMKMNNIPRNRHGYPTWSQIEYNMHSRYFPRREIMFHALNFVEKYNVCNASAMHIRETDLSKEMESKSQGRRKPSVQAYINFVESRPLHEPVFLLTDNPDTQKLFLSKYGPEKILIYSKMEDPINQLPMKVESLNDLRRKNTSNLAIDHRYTTLENTLIDVIIAAHAKEFKGTAFSSLTELVSIFNQIGRKDRGWCS